MLQQVVIGLSNGRKTSPPDPDWKPTRMCLPCRNRFCRGRSDEEPGSRVQPDEVGGNARRSRKRPLKRLAEQTKQLSGQFRELAARTGLEEFGRLVAQTEYLLAAGEAAKNAPAKNRADDPAGRAEDHGRQRRSAVVGNRGSHLEELPGGWTCRRASSPLAMDYSCRKPCGFATSPAGRQATSRTTPLRRRWPCFRLDRAESATGRSILRRAEIIPASPLGNLRFWDMNRMEPGLGVHPAGPPATGSTRPWWR